MRGAHLLSLLAQPQAIHPAAAAAYERHIHAWVAGEMRADEDDDYWPSPCKIYSGEDLAQAGLPLDNIPTLIISGTFMHATRGARPMSGMLSYDMACDAAERLFSISSPRYRVILRTDGGTVEGLESCGERLAALSKGKRCDVHIGETCASAGLIVAWGLAQGDGSQIIIPPQGQMGSAGVVSGIMGYTTAPQEHERFVWLSYPAGKALGRPGDLLSEEAIQRVSEDVQAAARGFIAQLSRLSGVPEDEIISWDGRMFIGTEAKARGLATKVGRLPGAKPAGTNSRGGATMLRSMTTLAALVGVAQINDDTDEKATTFIQQAAADAAQLKPLKAELEQLKATAAATDAAAAQVPALEARIKSAEERAKVAEERAAAAEASLKADREARAEAEDLAALRTAITARVREGMALTAEQVGNAAKAALPLYRAQEGERSHEQAARALAESPTSGWGIVLSPEPVQRADVGATVEVFGSDGDGDPGTPPVVATADFIRHPGF